MSRPKRKVAELGEHALSAAVGDVVARTMSAAAGRYDAHAGADDQLERLGTLLVMVHSAVDEAERVHIASWWLRRWLWRLRDAALDGDEVLRLFGQRRAAEGAAERAGGRVWSAARRAARAAKSLVLSAVAGDDGGGGVDRLTRTVARLENLCAGLGHFLKLLELEIMRSLSLQAPPPSGAGDARGHDGEPVAVVIRAQPDSTSLDVDDGSESELDLDLPYISDDEEAYISQAEYIACTLAIGLQIVARRFQRATMPATGKPRAPPDPDTDTAGMVAVIRDAVGIGGRAGVDGTRRWLAEWRRQLQAVADRADRVLLVVPAGGPAGGGGDEGGAATSLGDGEVWRTVRRLETAAAHVRAFVTLVRFAVVANAVA